MNVLHMKYAVEVARAGTLSRASETLLIAQPNISRSIKELENYLGITIFERTAKGMVLTPDGEVFINYARDIIKQIEEVEKLYKENITHKQQFSISVPRSSYISEAFVRFTKLLSTDAAEIFYNETHSRAAIENIINKDYCLGIIRYPLSHDAAFKAMLEEKNLHADLVTQFSYRLVVSRKHPLARKDKVYLSDLKDYIQIAHADPSVPSLTLSKALKEEQRSENDRKIYVFERASQFELLSENHEAFMWLSLVPPKILERYDLVEQPCEDNNRVYKDVLIYRNGYVTTTLDKLFISTLLQTVDEYT